MMRSPDRSGLEAADPGDPDDPESVAAAVRCDHFHDRAIVETLVRGGLDLDFDGQATPGKNVEAGGEGVSPERRGRADVLGRHTLPGIEPWPGD
ncbi:hypothetical protein KBD49_13725 [Myxococcota bacterium]|nr:hypothetical protein [Myxococcota bacterium]